MKYRRTHRFKSDFERLPRHIQKITREKFDLFRSDPRHPFLRLKKMKGHDRIWEGHITEGYVFTLEWDQDPQTGEDIAVFRRIGRHDIYDTP
jgi:mRNA-degrading endonuclease RelE of RelBE toxin-antitoxin system